MTADLKSLSQKVWLIPVIPAVRLRQEVQDYEANLNYTERFYAPQNIRIREVALWQST